MDRAQRVQMAIDCWMSAHEAALTMPDLEECLRPMKPEPTRSDLLRAAEALAKEHGERMSRSLFMKETRFTDTQIQRHFGRWSALREAVGLTVRAPIGSHIVTADDLVEQLRAYVNEHGSRVTLNEFVQAYKHSAATVHRRWGTWTALREAAGLEPYRERKRPTFTDAELLTDVSATWRALRERDGESRKFPTKAEHDACGQINSNTIRDRLGGSWAEVRRRVEELEKGST